jgi:hypothetical protein
MCSNSNGDISSTVVTEIRLGYDLCPKMDMSKKLIKQETEKILTSGIDYIQVLDQNHGGCSYFCYSLDHGHPPVPGKWQIEEVNSLLHSIERGKTLFGCESAASEPFISELLFSDNRFILNYYIGMPIPLYGYIYHEFVNNFMGNQICMALDTNEYSFPYRLAYSFSCGDMFTLVLNNNYDIMDAWCFDVAVDKEVVLSFINVLNEWRRKQKEYLHQGKMIEPLSYKVRENSFIHEDRSILKDKAVLTAAFNSDNGNMQFLINYNLNKETVEFEEEHEFYLNADLSKTIKTKQLIMEPLSVVAFKR